MEDHIGHSTIAPSSEQRRAERAGVVLSVVDYAFGALYVLIGVELVLELFAARDGNAIKQLLDDLTGPFLGPFRGLLPTYHFGNSEVVFSYLAALVLYALLHYGIRRVVQLVVHPREPV